MNIRRRAIANRVEKRAALDQQFQESEAYLAEVQAVIDSFKAEGRIKVTQEEFAARLHTLRTTLNEDGGR